MPGIRVEIIESPLFLEDFLKDAASPEQGGECSFVGRVRRRNLGREVKGVAYDVHEVLAKRSLEKIAEEARQRFETDAHVTIVHRQGYLEVGEASVLVAASCRHRHEAFVLCRYVIDELKHRTPIWKKEYYSDGESEWVQGHALCQHRQEDPHLSHGHESSSAHQ
jgi:molybdopterin synthase catalytic subunit